MCGGEQPIPAEAKGEKNAIASVLFLLASIDRSIGGRARDSDADRRPRGMKSNARRRDSSNAAPKSAFEAVSRETNDDAIVRARPRRARGAELIPDYSAPTRAIARDPARTRTRKTTRTRPRLGLGHELPRVRAPLMPLKHVREVRHRLLRGVVEAKPRVRVRGHHAESVAVHRVLASTMLLGARPVCSLARGAGLREGSSKSRERTPRAFPRRDALCDLCCASRRRADGVLRARVDAEKVRCCVFDGKRAGEPIGETVHLDRGCKMFRLFAHT